MLWGPGPLRNDADLPGRGGTDQGAGRRRRTLCCHCARAGAFGDGGGRRRRHGGRRLYAVTLAGAGTSGLVSLLVDGTSHALLAKNISRGEWEMDAGDGPTAVEVLTKRAAVIRKMSPAGFGRDRAAALKAPMPGLILQVAVEEGDEVEPGDRLVIVEAMKMENELRASVAGQVAKVFVVPGQAVEKDQVLVGFGGPGAA